ncbi:MAG: ATP-binding protein, partial [Chloroflexota bacterium]
VRAQRDESATDLLRTLKQSLAEFMGETPVYDDITLIVAKCVAPESGGRVHGEAGTLQQFAFSADEQLESLALFRAFVERACADTDVHPDTCFQLTLVVDEACANVIQYGYADLPRTPIELTFVNDGEQVVITISDRARPFPPEQAPAPDLDSNWEERRVGGLGWHLIRSLVNEVRYESLPDGRNVLTLVKRLDKSADELET